MPCATLPKIALRQLVTPSLLEALVVLSTYGLHNYEFYLDFQSAPSVSMVVTADSGYQSNLYNSNGAYSGLTSPGTLTATTVSVSGVPEVSTWAMMLAGFAALGFTGYRRNKNAAVAA